MKTCMASSTLLPLVCISIDTMKRQSRSNAISICATFNFGSLPPRPCSTTICIVSPALGGRICLGHPPRERPLGMGAARQILHEMARPNLMRRNYLEPGEEIGFEILFERDRREPGVGRRDIVEALRRAPLQRAGRIHRGRGRRALEPRSLLDFRQQIARNGCDVIMAGAAWSAGGNSATWWWLFAYFVVVTIGELYLSPIGLSLVSKIALARMISTMMGLWLGTSFIGNFVAGWLGSFWSSTDKMSFFIMIAAVAASAGAVIWFFNRPLKGILQG